MIDCTISNSLNTDGNGFMIYLRSFVETEPVLIDNCYFHDNIGTNNHGFFFHSTFTNIIFNIVFLKIIITKMQMMINLPKLFIYMK